MELTRRTFLKIAMSGVVAAAAAETMPRALAAPPIDRGNRVVPTFCEICFWNCGVLAHVRDGQVWKLTGNPLDPLSRGRLCPRGTGGVGALRDPDRLRRPLMRARQRGQEVWREASWEEALGYIADRMQAIRAQHGPEAMALLHHGIGARFFTHTFKAYGTPNLAAPSYAHCSGARDAGFSLTFGDDPGGHERTDIANARCLVLIGSHLGENMHNSQVQEFADFVHGGGTLIVADPRQSTAAAKAKWWLPVKPGTDTALLLAWMHVLVQEKLYDRAYVERFGHGFDAFSSALDTCTPEWAWVETGIEPETIRETARAMAREQPTLVHCGRRSNWYGHDVQRSRAIALLNALLGSWGRKGGFFLESPMEIPPYPCPPYPRPARPACDHRRFPFADEVSTTGVRDATLTGQPYPIKGWMVYATNLLYSMPRPADTIRAIQQLDLLVVVDVIPSEIAGWADVVLPEATYLERHDELNVMDLREPFVSLRQPVVAAPDEQKPNWWMARELARRLGLGAWYPWKTIEEYHRKRCALAHLDYDALKRDGIAKGRRGPIYFAEGARPEFDTPSKKIEFWSDQLRAAGFDAVPRYEPPPAGPPGSFRLLTGRAPMHTFSRTENNPLLFNVMAENLVWVNGDEAARLGLHSGDRVRLRNQDGALSDPIMVKATQRIRPDCVFLVHGFGHTARGLRLARGRGASDTQLLTHYENDPIMGATSSFNNFVTLEPV